MLVPKNLIFKDASCKCVQVTFFNKSFFMNELELKSAAGQSDASFSKVPRNQPLRASRRNPRPSKVTPKPIRFDDAQLYSRIEEEPPVWVKRLVQQQHTMNPAQPHQLDPEFRSPLCWDANKAVGLSKQRTLISPAGLTFLLKVPLRYLRSSIIYLIPLWPIVRPLSLLQ